MISGIHHTGIVVNDLRAMVSFYCDAFGLEIVGEIDSIAPPEGNHTGIPNSKRKLVFVGLPGEKHLLELIRYIEPPASPGHLGKHQFGVAHVCFCVDDLDSEYERLKNLGVRFETEPKYSQSAAGRIGVIYGRDPEDNWLELIEGELGF